MADDKSADKGADAAKPTGEGAKPAEKPAEKPAKDEKRLDETVPGGRYARADGTIVNAHGKPIK